MKLCFCLAGFQDQLNMYRVPRVYCLCFRVIFLFLSSFSHLFRIVYYLFSISGFIHHKASLDGTFAWKRHNDDSTDFLFYPHYFLCFSALTLFFISTINTYLTFLFHTSVHCAPATPSFIQWESSQFHRHFLLLLILLFF